MYARARQHPRGGGAVHPSWAAAAARSAASRSAGLETGARAYSLPVLGSTTSLARPEAGGTCSPLTKLASSRTRAVGCAVAVNGGLLARGSADPVLIYSDPTLAENQIAHK